MKRLMNVHALVAAVFVASLLPDVGGTGYDVGGSDALTWTDSIPTTYSICQPEEMDIEFVSVPPRLLFAWTPITTNFRVAFNTSRFAPCGSSFTDSTPLTASLLLCDSLDVGFCTPFVPSDKSRTFPSTPTSSFTIDGSGIARREFSADFRFPEAGTYTVVAHMNIDLCPDGSSTSTTRDLAAGFFAHVRQPATEAKASDRAKEFNIVFSALGTLFLASMLIGVTFFRSHSIMKSSQVRVLQVILLIGMWIVATTALLGYEGRTTCRMRSIFYDVPLCLLFGLMYGRVLRVYLVIEASNKLRARPVPVSFVFVVGIIITIPIALAHLVRGIVSPFDYVRSFSDNGWTFEMVCMSEQSHMTFWTVESVIITVTLVFGLYVARISSQLIARFNEGTSLGFAIQNAATLSLIGITLEFGLKGDPSMRLALLTLTRVLLVCVLVGFLVAPKLRSLLSGEAINRQRRNTKSSSDAVRLSQGVPHTSKSAAVRKGVLPIKEEQAIIDAAAAIARIQARILQSLRLSREQFDELAREAQLLQDIVGRLRWEDSEEDLETRGRASDTSNVPALEHMETSTSASGNIVLSTDKAV